ncbi:hypothetical protein R3X25_03440 [Lutibacter sp. TH_r2]|uniref:hypothetical protein n=1 Tax=Lutibacter sp. TH_r2 TaxID=3082083 RepID=UPI002953066A|nr:hypothetical protein [Lutibacter sp. TH_r2]MDV7186324.1 hypothetical protein [Lutibacter sp. TH_r2]
MKKLLIYLAAILLIMSCKPVQKTTAINQEELIDMETISQNIEDCMENSTCTLEIIPNKTIEFKKDKFNIGYPVINNGNKILLKYTFSKNTEKSLKDGSYTEIVYAELSSIENMTLINQDLQQIKLYFGRLCYCKGETGYFPIEKGSFSIARLSENKFNFDINFTITQVPQIISSINQTISLK